MASKIFKDPIHGSIEIPGYCVKIIDTPAFQRLRHIRQLAYAEAVYPSANHSRFSHSLGTCYLAGKVVRTLREKQPSLEISKDDIKLVEIAGLCHDLGHGPFSHEFEKIVERVTEMKFAHETASTTILEVMKDKFDLQDTEVTKICNMIQGKPPKDEPEKKFLYQIVSNEANGIDVDKWDYFARDCYHLGIKADFEHERLHAFLRVVAVVDASGVTTYEIGFRDKEKESIAALFTTRWKLHLKACHHRVCGLVKEMVNDVLVEYFKWTSGLSGDEQNSEFILNEFLTTETRPTSSPGILRDYKVLKKDMASVEEYCKMDDRLLHKIALSKCEALDTARNILDRVDRRKHYHPVAVFQEYQGKDQIPESQDNSGIVFMRQLPEVDSIKKDLKSKCSEELVVVEHEINYGKGNKDPLEHVYFYGKKENPDEIPEGFRLLPHQMPQTQPKTTKFKMYRVYTREEVKTDEGDLREKVKESVRNLEKLLTPPSDTSSVTASTIPPLSKKHRQEDEDGSLKDAGGAKRQLKYPKQK